MPLTAGAGAPLLEEPPVVRSGIGVSVCAGAGAPLLEEPPVVRFGAGGRDGATGRLFQRFVGCAG